MNKNHLFSAIFFSKRLISTLILSGCFFAGVQALTWAGSNPGLTIFSGVENRNDILDYHLDFNGRPRQVGERYRLYVPGKKLTQGASKFFISYLERPKFDGKFNLDKVEVRVDGESLPLKDVYWDKESRVVEIELETPMEVSKKVEIVFSGVKNPSNGTYYLICDVLSSGDRSIRMYIGTWIVSIERV